jgi:DNA-binding IclR family transcriptional regulator
MTRGSPSVDRVVSILTLLASAPERSFTLADIVRHTELSKATSHAVLASLVETRWLLRHPHGPSYRLGPGLIAMGEAARRGYPELPYALDVMRELGTEFGLECLASAVVGSDIVILGKSGAPVPLSVTAAIGQRVPLVPPLATVFFSWSDEAAVASAFGTWSGEPGAGRRVPSALTDKYRKALTAVRQRGYAIGLENPVRERLGRTLVSQLARGQLTAPEGAEIVAALAEEDYQLIDLAATERYWLSYVAAPIFDASGRVSLALTLVGFSSPLEADEVHRLGQRLRRAADSVTRAVHGAPPLRSTFEEALR